MQVSGKSKTGALHILKNVRHNLWKKYRFTLYSSFLAYYSDDEQMYPQGIIVLKHISSINNEEPSDRYEAGLIVVIVVMVVVVLLVVSFYLNYRVPEMPMSERQEAKYERNPDRRPAYFTITTPLRT